VESTNQSISHHSCWSACTADRVVCGLDAKRVWSTVNILVRTGPERRAAQRLQWTGKPEYRTHRRQRRNHVLKHEQDQFFPSFLFSSPFPSSHSPVQVLSLPLPPFPLLKQLGGLGECSELPQQIRQSPAIRCFSLKRQPFVCLICRSGP